MTSTYGLGFVDDAYSRELLDKKNVNHIIIPGCGDDGVC